MAKPAAKPLAIYIRNENTKKILTLLPLAFPGMKAEEIVGLALDKLWEEAADRVKQEVIALQPRDEIEVGDTKSRKK